ncbi:hypothetical protein Tco_0432956 [Tanacetum coccineum]
MRTTATKDDKPKTNTYSVVDVATLDTHQMDLFNLIKAPNPTKVNTGTRQRTAHEVPLLTTTGAEVGVHGLAAAKQEIPVTDDAGATEAAVEPDIEKEVISMGPTIKKRRRQRDAGEGGSNAPAKVLRKDHDAARAEHSARGGKSLADMSVDTELAIHVQETQEPPVATQSVNDPDPLSYVKPQSKQEYAHQYNINQARQVVMGSQLRLRFEQEAKLLKKSVAQVTRRDQRIATREKHIKDLEAQLEAEINMKKAAEVKNSKVTKELEDLRMRFSGLEVGNAQLSQQVSVLQA